jgi:hypothetical protein
MLLVIELARTKIELETENVPLPVGHDQVPSPANGIGDQLDDIGVDGDARVAQREEHVHTRADSAQQKANDPCADGVCWNVDIVIPDNGSNLVICQSVVIFVVGGSHKVARIEGSQVTCDRPKFRKKRTSG